MFAVKPTVFTVQVLCCIKKKKATDVSIVWENAVYELSAMYVSITWAREVGYDTGLHLSICTRADCPCRDSNPGFFAFKATHGLSTIESFWLCRHVAKGKAATLLVRYVHTHSLPTVILCLGMCACVCMPVC